MADNSERNGPSYISSNNIMALPNIKRIRNIAEFMAQPENRNAEIEEVIDRMTMQAKQSRLIVFALKERIQLKQKTMSKIKADLLQLQQQIRQPGAFERLMVGDEKISVEYSDEAESMLLPLASALDQFSLKMGTLRGEIWALHSDVAYVVYLKSIAEVNRKAVCGWFAQKRAKDAKETSAL